VAVAADLGRVEDRGIERRGLAAVGALVGAGGGFVDVGANIGYYTIAGGVAVGAGGTVHAFEPSPETFGLLQATVERNRLEARIELHQLAAGAVNDRQTLLDHDVDLLSSLVSGPLHGAGTYVRREVEVRAVDDVVAGRVDMIKVDVEGGEIDVLAGCGQIFQRNPELAVMVELAPQYLRAAGVSLDRLVDALPDGDRVVYVIEDRVDGPNPLGPVRPLHELRSWVEQDAPPLWYANLLSVPRAREANVAGLAHVSGGA
jgi:FkbM family methyltransferase